MNILDYKAALVNVSHKANMLGITQEDISIATGISQSQISRVLSGQSKKPSKSFEEICNYVNRYQTGVSAELVKENVELVDALASVWDGTTTHANALAVIIRSLGLLTSSIKTRSEDRT